MPSLSECTVLIQSAACHSMTCANHRLGVPSIKLPGDDYSVPTSELPLRPIDGLCVRQYEQEVPTLPLHSLTIGEECSASSGCDDFSLHSADSTLSLPPKRFEVPSNIPRAPQMASSTIQPMWRITSMATMSTAMSPTFLKELTLDQIEQCAEDHEGFRAIRRQRALSMTHSECSDANSNSITPQQPSVGVDFGCLHLMRRNFSDNPLAPTALNQCCTAPLRKRNTEMCVAEQKVLPDCFASLRTLESASDQQLQSCDEGDAGQYYHEIESLMADASPASWSAVSRRPSSPPFATGSGHVAC